MTTRIAFAALLFLAACTGASSSPGVDQPIVVRGAQLRHGPLPGTPLEEGGVVSELRILSLENAESIIRLGQIGKTFSGRATGDVVAIGIALEGVGDSHWIIPVGPPDLNNPGSYLFDFIADFGTEIPSGTHRLAAVAIDAAGAAGTIFYRNVCVLPDVPDNGSTCIVNAVSPDTVVSLTWSTDVDLDLIVVTPSGKVVSLKRPNTTDADGGLTQSQVNDPSNGQLTRDSNGECVIDSIRRESLVFDGPPPPGTYRFYARLTQACGHDATTYSLETFRLDAGALVRTDRIRGDFLAMQASGASGLGTFVTEISFP